MATRPHEVVGRLAVERARARNPALAPDTVEVVELVRGSVYVIVRTYLAGVVVLDAHGRLVRGRDRLVRIARHVRAVFDLDTAQTEAGIDRRLEHAQRSLSFFDRLDRPDARVVADELRRLEQRLELVLAERRRGMLATERTLRRRIELHNDAARADRGVVLATRRLAGMLVSGAGSRSAELSALERWVAGRLGSQDLPFFLPELGAAEADRFVNELVLATRAS